VIRWWAQARHRIDHSGDLVVDHVTVAFGKVIALDGVSAHLSPNEILGLIGPNGAGKTTLINVLSGFEVPSRGAILDGNTDITGLAPHRRARRGVVRTFQAVRLFPSATIAGNVMPAALATSRRRRDAAAAAGRALELVGLADRSAEPTRSLPHGDERLVGIARALAANPRFLLLDEPAAGLNDAETTALGATLRQIRERVGCGILLIEHDFPLIMAVCDRIHVLDHGQTIAEGSPEVIRKDPAVLTAYLGAPARGD
jgi:branched-chain amino acid transport system ATP-binding protein